jgi:hypothetical protein
MSMRCDQWHGLQIELMTRAAIYRRLPLPKTATSLSPTAATGASGELTAAGASLLLLVQANQQARASLPKSNHKNRQAGSLPDIQARTVEKLCPY